eukprot:4072399-Amphidinium_carterae.1
MRCSHAYTLQKRRETFDQNVPAHPRERMCTTSSMMLPMQAPTQTNQNHNLPPRFFCAASALPADECPNPNAKPLTSHSRGAPVGMNGGLPDSRMVPAQPEGHISLLPTSHT